MLFNEYASFPLDFSDVLHVHATERSGAPTKETLRTASVPCLGYMMRLLYACFINIPEVSFRIQQVFELRKTCDSLTTLRAELSINASNEEEYGAWIPPSSYWAFTYCQSPVVPCATYIELLSSTLYYENQFNKLREKCHRKLPFKVARALDDSGFFEDVRSICYLLTLVFGHYRSLGNEELGLAESYYEFLRLTQSMKYFTASAFCRPRRGRTFGCTIQKCCNFVARFFMTDYHMLAFYLHPAARDFFRDTSKNTLISCMRNLAQLHGYTDEEDIRKCMQRFEEYSSGDMDPRASSSWSVPMQDSPEPFWKKHVGKRRKILRDIALQLLSVTGYSGENVSILHGASEDDGEELLQLRCFLLHREVQKADATSLPRPTQRQCCHSSLLAEESTSFVEQRVQKELRHLSTNMSRQANDGDPMLVINGNDLRLFRDKCLKSNKVPGDRLLVEETLDVERLFR